MLVGVTHLSRQCTANDQDGSLFGKPASGCEGNGSPGQIRAGSGPLQGKNFIDPNKTTQNDFGLVLTIGGAIATAGFGTVLIWKLFGYDGDDEDHNLTRPDATLYVERYNRTLLRKTVKLTETRIKSLSSGGYGVHVRPVLSPGFAGVTGTF